MKKEKPPVIATHEAIVKMGTRLKLVCRVEYQTVEDLLWSVTNLLCCRKVPIFISLPSGQNFTSIQELRQKGGEV